jgi:hypothetical protein
MSERIVNTNGAADMRTDHQILGDEAAIALEPQAGGGALMIRSSWIVRFDFMLPRISATARSTSCIGSIAMPNSRSREGPQQSASQRL